MPYQQGSRDSRPNAEGAQQHRSGDQNAQITQREIEDVEERSSPRTPIIYEVVRRLGEEEMARPATSLWWSGLAAGLSISFSLLAQAILQLRIPEEGWRPLVTSLGYSVGFVMVVLSRQQLFTENTITVVLPVMASWSMANVGRAARMWGIVLLANLVGTLFAAAFCTFTPVLSPDLRNEMLEISSQILQHDWIEMLFRGIAAGFLIATMVWLLPGAESGQFSIIVVTTYLIGAGGFMHIVAGSMEAFMLVLNRMMSPDLMFVAFLMPVLAGNIIGGTALFALLAYAQVMREI
ncbi:formate/nitrite transporter family protein [Bradyrhizobium sp. STM 3562]|uniref:formate/nitrite transporter family protein n=1 Tax=Bradyrhizobium sp. STM 3562 TaxID=578924 RepID=UPI00388DDA1E